MKWTTETRKISDLIPADYNPRQLTEKQAKDLSKSLEKFDLADPIVINQNNRIIGGHQRIKILQQKGIQEVDVRVPERQLDEKEEKELNIRLNKNLGEWDFDALANNFNIDDLLEWGFDEKDLKIDMPVEEDDVPEVQEEAVSRLGEVYQLGNHRLMCGDSTKIEDVEKLMDGQKADMVFTDPPYNVDYSGGMHADGTQSKREKIKNDKMSSDDFYQFLYSVMKNLLSVTQGAFYVCMSSSELHNLWKAFTDAGGHWQTYVIWAKDAFTLSRSDYQHQFEPIMYGLDDKSVEEAINQVDEDKLPIMYGWSKHYWYGGRKQGDVWRIDRPKISKEHPTMKPVALCAKAICNSSLRNQIVLDTFVGSFSTGMACEQLDRRCFAMELDPRYVDVCIKRWENFTGEKAVKL